MKKRNFSLGTILLYLAAVFQATQYARAFHDLFPTSAWAQASGILGGAVVNVALAYSASRLPRIRSPKAGRFAFFSFWTLIIMTPIFLSLVNYQTMGDLWKDVPVLRWMVAIISASVVDIAIALVAFSDSSLLPIASATLPAKVSDAQRRSRSLPARSSDAQRRLPATLYRCECGETFPNRFKFSGHQGKCAAHQSNRSGPLIPVEIPKPISVKKGNAK